MSGRGRRRSIEQAPLLRDSDSEDARLAQEDPPSLAERISSAIQEPLTSLTKVLLVVALILLLLTSIFIGLFAGVKYKLYLERHSHDGGGEHKPPVGTVTTTAVTTVVSTSTATLTTTRHGVPVPVPTSPPKEDVCLTSDCIILSASILTSLDTTQDPCENFYQFANGGWLKSHPLPSDKGTIGVFEVLAQQNQQVLKSILESNTSASSPPSDDDQILRKLGDLYSSCMNEKRLDAVGEEPLLHLVNTVRQLYRSEKAEIRSNDEDQNLLKTNGLTAALAFLHSRDVEALFDFDIEGDVGEDPNHLTLWFSQPTQGLPSKEYYEDKSIRELYQDVIKRLLLTLSDDDDEDSIMMKRTDNALVIENEDNANAWPPWPWPPWEPEDPDDDDDHKTPVNKTERALILSGKVLEFETQIANASLDLEDLYDPILTYNPLPIDNLTSSLSQIHFPDYFSAFTPRSFPSRVIVTHPPYLSALSGILSNTSSDVIESYLVTRAALSLAPHLGMNTEAWQAVRTLTEKLGGLKKGAVGDRAEFCVEKVENALGFAAGRYFVNETFGRVSQEKGTKVITNIVTAFKRSLSHIEWMDKASATAAAEKADAIRIKVGFPLSPDTRSAASIANYYRAVEIDENFFDNMLHAATIDKFRTWLQLDRKRDLQSWEMYPSTVNAYFNPPANEIVFPAGILQPPFYSQEWPSYLVYGAFGMVASHELTHAFDSMGRMYNQHGKLEQWWSNATSEGFNEKQDCIAKQYSAYTIDDGKGGKIHVNGNLTSGENIGDTGLIQAWRAWKGQYHTSFKGGNEYLLPGLSFTREQLFFISFARIWARKMTPAAAVQRIRSDPHSPNQLRVEGAVTNIPEFAVAFNCPKGAKLNPPPEKRCNLW